MQQSHCLAHSSEWLVFSRTQYPFFGIWYGYFCIAILGRNGCMGCLQKLSKSCCSCWVPAGNVEQAGSRASLSCRGKIQPNSSCSECGCTPASPRLQALRLLTQGGFRGARLVFSCFFSTLIFNSVSTGRCRQMWAHPARTPSQPDLCQPLSRSHRAVLSWLYAQASMSAEKPRAEEACVCLHRA